MELIRVLAYGILFCLWPEVLADKAKSRSNVNDYDPSEAPNRLQKRSLVYPTPSTLLLIFGLGTPLQLDRESVIVGAFTKMLYNLPTNATDFTEPGVLYSRKDSRSRWSIYRTLAGLADLYGFGEGRVCVLRAICEVAAAPFDPGHGLLHQLLQSLLSPSSTKEKLEEYQDREYQAAERLGKHVGENCHALYPECRRSFLDLFSTVKPLLTSLFPTTKS